MVADQQTLIDELESSIANKAIGGRAEILRRVTALFASGSTEFAPEQVALFDNVMARLIDQIDTCARAALAPQLLATSNVPPKTLRKLALDESLDVSRTILSQCEQLDDETLLEGANTRSQGHLLAIASRRTISEVVTDVLVDRGNRQVAICVAENSGARFSECGYTTLVKRSEHDGALARRIWARPDVPRKHLLALVSSASEAVRQELVAADRRKADLIQEMISRASDQIQQLARENSEEFKLAYSNVQRLYQVGELNETQLRNYAIEGKLDETVIAIAFLCQLHVGLIERVLIQGLSDQVIIIAKSLGLKWETTKAIFLVGAGARGYPKQTIDEVSATFEKLREETANRAMEFYRLRDRATRGNSPSK